MVELQHEASAFAFFVQGAYALGEGARRVWWWNVFPQLRTELDTLRWLPLVLVQGQGEHRWTWVQKAETLASFRKMNTPPSEESRVS